MEDEVILKPNDIGGFSFAAVLDGHAGFSSVEFLREDLYKECVAALQGGMLLTGKSLSLVKKALEDAFVNADIKLLKWLEEKEKEDESGSTATVMFARNDNLIISHVGDSSVVISRSGKAEVLTNPHCPCGNNKVSLQEIRTIKEAGGWELDYLVGAVSNPKKSFAAIVGVSSKIGVIESLLEKVDILLLGGGVIFTFYKAQGHKVGGSCYFLLLFRMDGIGHWS